MSTDFNAVCDSCKLHVHAGQIMACIPSFGWNSSQTGSQVAVAAWVYKHAYHGAGVRIEVSDTSIERPSDDYPEVELEDWVKSHVTGQWESPKESAAT